MGEADPSGRKDGLRGDFTGFEAKRSGYRVGPVKSLVDVERLAQLAGAGTKITKGFPAAPLHHEVHPLAWFDRAYQHGLSHSFWSGN
jgi:hypothetical protein